MSRLGSADTTYEFLRRALGWSVVLQVVWIFDDEIPTETLASMHKWLGQGRLHRRLAAAKVPGARPRWVPAGALPELAVDIELERLVHDLSGWSSRGCVVRKFAGSYVARIGEVHQMAGVPIRHAGTAASQAMQPWRPRKG